MAEGQGWAVKYGCLAFLAIQNSAYILTLRYSRTLPGDRYLTSTAVLLAEILKCIVSLFMFLLLAYRARTADRQEKTTGPPDQTALNPELDEGTIDGWPSLIPKTKSDILSFLPILVPAVLYTITNNLQFVAVSNLEAATFQVLYQGKLLTTAVCAVIFLGKHLTLMQALSILLLTIGVASASVPPKTAQTNPHAQSHVLGIAAVSIACLLSGFAGVYTEKILKKTQQSSADPKTAFGLFWYRNFQLSLASILFAVFGCFVVDHQQLLAQGFFQGYNGVTVATIFLQAIGGLAVAVVITWADNILKGFATSLSVIISTIASVAIWQFVVTPLFFAGMTAVLVATTVYGWADRKSPEKKPEYAAVRTEEARELDELAEFLEDDDDDDSSSSSTKPEHNEDMQETKDFHSRGGSIDDTNNNSKPAMDEKPMLVAAIAPSAEIESTQTIREGSGSPIPESTTVPKIVIS